MCGDEPGSQIAQCWCVEGYTPGSCEFLFWVTIFFLGHAKNSWPRRKKCVTQGNVFYSFPNMASLLSNTNLQVHLIWSTWARSNTTLWFFSTLTSHKPQGRVTQNKEILWHAGDDFPWVRPAQLTVFSFRPRSLRLRGIGPYASLQTLLTRSVMLWMRS